MNQAMGKRYVAHSQILPLSKGHLYYGEDLSLQRDVILYASEYREGSASHDYMTRLGKASALTHESFQHILDTSLEGETLLVVLNRGNGSPLFEKVGETGWTFHKIITLVSELGKGMLDAMEAGLTGYSVACENLWLKDDGRAAVINYWETGVTETQGASGLCVLLGQLAAGSAYALDPIRALEKHLGGPRMQASPEQKAALMKLVRNVWLDQASLSSLVFGLQGLLTSGSPAKESPSAAARTGREEPPVRKPQVPADTAPWAPAKERPPVRAAAPASATEEAGQEVASGLPAPKKWLVGLSALIVAGFLIWLLLPSDKPDKRTAEPPEASSSPGPTASGGNAGGSKGGPSTKPSPSLSPTPSPSAEGAKAETGIVPALVGLTKEDAEKQAVAAGLHYNFFLENDSLPAGAVFKQDPPAGTPAAKGDNVTFWVSKGP